MSKGTFKITIKGADLSGIADAYKDISPIVEIALGGEVKTTKVSSEGGFKPIWNEQLVLKKKTSDFHMSVAITSKKDILCFQELGINTFVKKGCTINHMIELMNQGLPVGELLVSIEFEPEETIVKHSWKNTNTTKHQYALHKLLISKIKANIEVDDEQDDEQQYDSAPCVRISLGRRFWMTSTINSSGTNFTWNDSFNIVIENEQELSLEILHSDKPDAKLIGSAMLKLKQIHKGSSPNKVPITKEGKTIGYLSFQSDHHVPSQRSQTTDLLNDKSSPFFDARPTHSKKQLGRLVINTLRIYLDKDSIAEDPYIHVLYAGNMQKTTVFSGVTNKMEWREQLIFEKPSNDTRLEFKLLDKHAPSDDEPVGYGLILLDPALLDGGKLRSQKVDLFYEDQLVGQLYVDCEYQGFPYQCLIICDIFIRVESGLLLEGNSRPGVDFNDMKKLSKPTEKDIWRKELLKKRKELMKATGLTEQLQQNQSFLPQLSNNLNKNASIFSVRGPNTSLLSPLPAVKAIHSVKLPKVDYPINVKEYRQIYKQSVFGLGMSNVHSAESLRHSVPSYSLSKATRFEASTPIIDSQPILPRSSPQVYAYTKEKIFTPDQKYQIVHKSPAQKVGASFGVGSRFSNKHHESSPGFYQGPQIVNMKD